MELTKEQVQALAGIAELAPKIKEVTQEGFATAKDVADLREQLTEAQKDLRKRIRNSKSGLYVSGIEDVDFRVSKAMLAIAYSVKSGLPHPTQAMFERFGAGKEFETLKAIEKKHGDDLFAMKAAADPSFKAPASIGSDQLGGAFIADQVLDDVIGALYANAAFISVGGIEGSNFVRVVGDLPGLSGQAYPKFEGGAHSFWMDEEEAYKATEIRVNKVRMTPKKLGTLIYITEEMERADSMGVEEMIRADMTRSQGEKLDWTIAYGTGSGGNGEGGMPLGIANQPGVLIGSAQAIVNGDATPFYVNGTGSPADLNSGTWAGGDLDPTHLDEIKAIMFDQKVRMNPAHHGWISEYRWFTRMKNLRTSFFSTQAANEKGFTLGAFMSFQQLAGLIGPFGYSQQLPNAYGAYAANAGKAGNTVGATAGGDGTAAKFSDLFYSHDWSESILGRWSGMEIDTDGGGILFLSDMKAIKVRSYWDFVMRRPSNTMLIPDARVRS